MSDNASTPLSHPASNARHADVPLPPGMVLGPDGKPCKVCVGKDWKSWSNPGGKSAKTRNAAAATAGAGAATVAASSSSSSESVAAPVSRDECPADVESLGRATWTFLHTAAAYYPTHPTPIQQRSMLSLLHSLPFTYPCHHCASHLEDNFKVHPPSENVVSSRGVLSEWLCRRHNDVNERLGKKAFDCAKTDERWLTGPSDGSCD